MLAINTEYQRGIMLVRLKGELVKDTIYKYDKKVINKLEDLKNCHLVLNVMNLTTIDYKGINKLLYVYEIIKRKQGKTLLCGNNSNIKKKLKKSRILNYIYETKDEINAMKIINEGRKNG